MMAPVATAQVTIIQRPADVVIACTRVSDVHYFIDMGKAPPGSRCGRAETRTATVQGWFRDSNQNRHHTTFWFMHGSNLLYTYLPGHHYKWPR